MGKILITGGAGYIGTNLAVNFLEEGKEIIVVDDLRNSYVYYIKKLQKTFKKQILFLKLKVQDYTKMKKIFSENDIETVIHLSARKYVKESIAKPKEYIENNISSLKTILSLCEKFKVQNFAFASTSLIYGNAKEIPIPENSNFSITNAYVQSKFLGEEKILAWHKKTKINTVIFRFSNPVGANTKYMLGDHNKSRQSSLIPYVINCVFNNESPVFRGNDYNTKDGTPIRDYIHICDLTRIVKNVMLSSKRSRLEILNLGCNNEGSSVLEIVKTVEKITNKKLKYTFVPSNGLEAPIICLDSQKLMKKFNQKCELSLEDMVHSQIEFYKFIKKNYGK